MKKYFLFASPLLFSISVAVAMISGNDKAIFIVIFSLVYGLMGSFFFLGRLTKAVDKKKAGLDLFIVSSPIIFTAFIVFLAKQGIIEGI